MRVALATLGCKVNQAESASMGGLLKSKGFEVVSFKEKADFYILNTCSVTAKSDYQSRQLVRRANRKEGKLIVTGCYAELRPEELKHIGNIDFFIKNSEKKDILYFILPEFKNHQRVLKRSQTDINGMHLYYHSKRSRALLKIQDGCEAFCAYCTVPSARGKNRSLPIENSLEAVEKMIQKGFKEIVLTGIHIGRYGVDLKSGISLFELVRNMILKYPHTRFRLSSIEPEEFDPAFLDLIKDEHLCSHLHFPLQSGSEDVLKAMKRKGKIFDFKQMIKNVHEALPDIAIGTDVIAGLPGESEEDFSKSYRLIEELPISYVHVFPYSPRPGTIAATMKNQVSPEIKKKRAEILRDLSRKKHYQYITSMSGKVLDVIVENHYPHQLCWSGVSQNYLKVLVLSNKSISSRQRIKVKVVGIKDALPLCKVL